MKASKKLIFVILGVIVFILLFVSTSLFFCPSKAGVRTLVSSNPVLSVVGSYCKLTNKFTSNTPLQNNESGTNIQISGLVTTVKDSGGKVSYVQQGYIKSVNSNEIQICDTDERNCENIGLGGKQIDYIERTVDGPSVEVGNISAQPFTLKKLTLQDLSENDYIQISGSGQSLTVTRVSFTVSQ